MTSPEDGRPQVAVIGAGWAGCSAALALARQGIAVTVYEQARIPGGRARRIVVDGAPLDNGQHLLIGAYRECLRLIDSVHGRGAAAATCLRLPLTLQPWGRQPGALQLTAWNAPAPWHLAGALVGARGLGLGARWAFVTRFLRLARHPAAIPATATVADWFRELPGEAFEGIVAPLCIAALNTLPEDASARIFANVLHATFAGPRAHSDFLIPAIDLTALLPEPALRQVVDRGGEVHLGAAARVTAARAGRVEIESGGKTASFAAAVIAVAPHQLGGSLGPAVADAPSCRTALAMTAAFAYEPIVTVYLTLAEPMPLSLPIMRLDDRPGQWLFVRRGPRPAEGTTDVGMILAVVVSAHGEHERLAQDALADTVEAQLRRLEPALPTVVSRRVIAERRATYACTPGLARPAPGHLAPGLALAGDYTDADFPATLEAAVRSGHAAAAALLASLAGRFGALP